MQGEQLRRQIGYAPDQNVGDQENQYGKGYAGCQHHQQEQNQGTRMLPQGMELIACRLLVNCFHFRPSLTVIRLS